MVSRVVFSQEKSRAGGILAGNALSYSRSPFPPGDRVTFNGKDCVCQKCSLPQSVGSSEPLCQGLWSKWARQGCGGRPLRCREGA